MSEYLNEMLEAHGVPSTKSEDLKGDEDPNRWFVFVPFMHGLHEAAMRHGGFRSQGDISVAMISKDQIRDWNCGRCGQEIDITFTLHGPADDPEVAHLSVEVPIPVPMLVNDPMCANCADDVVRGMKDLGDKGNDMIRRLNLWAPVAQGAIEGAVGCGCEPCNKLRNDVMTGHRHWQTMKNEGKLR